MKIINYDIRRNVNFPLLAVVALLLALGTTVIFSATSAMPGASGFMLRHVVGIVLGLVLMVGFWIFDYRHFTDAIIPLWILNVFLIISPRIPGIGSTGGGSERWLAIGTTNIMQPSEPAKLVTILLLAAIVARYEGEIYELRDFLKVLVLSLIPPALMMIFISDLGTALVFVAISLGILWVGGARLRYVAVLLAIGITFAFGFVYIESQYAKENDGDGHILKEYQLNRLMVFVDPTVDPRGAGYNLSQAKISIGSGEFSGKGLGSGTQSNLNFLPERHTDFIFAVLGEEAGFLGAVTLLGLYLALLVVALSICASSVDLYGSLIAAGIMSMWVFQIFENVGMNMGLMPITGIPLPFMSYGSSFLVTNLAAVGVLLSIWRQRTYQSPIKGVDDDGSQLAEPSTPALQRTQSTRTAEKGRHSRRSSSRPRT